MSPPQSCRQSVLGAWLCPCGVTPCCRLLCLLTLVGRALFSKMPLGTCVSSRPFAQSAMHVACVMLCPMPCTLVLAAVCVVMLHIVCVASKCGSLSLLAVALCTCLVLCLHLLGIGGRCGPACVLCVPPFPLAGCCSVVSRPLKRWLQPLLASSHGAMQRRYCRSLGGHHPTKQLSPLP